MLRPPLTASAHFSGASTESYDLLLDDSGVIYVSALVNGKPALFLLDSLWGIDALTEDAAKRLGIETKMDLDPSHPSATIRRLQIGGFVLENDPVTIQPSAGWKADGLLGFGFFSQAVVGIHWASRTMTLSDPARFSPPAGYTAVPLTIQENRSAEFDANIDGLDGKFLLGVGRNEGAILYPGFVAYNKVREKYLGDEEAASTPPPERENRNGTAFHLSSVSLNKPYITIMRPDALAKYDIAGRIGDHVLERMDESVDYTHHQMFVLPNGIVGKSIAEKPAEPSNKLSFAPFYIEANKAPGAGSPAAAADKRLLADFQRQFTKLAADTGPVTAYSHFCTPGFTMTTRLFGSVQQTLARSKFLEAVRTAKASSEDSESQAFSIFSTVRSAESGAKTSDGKLTYAAPDKFETRGNQIVYSNYPVFTSTGADVTTSKSVFEETFVKAGNGLLLKSVELIGLSMSAQGHEMPKEFIMAMFSADPIAAMKALSDQESKEKAPTGK